MSGSRALLVLSCVLCVAAVAFGGAPGKKHHGPPPKDRCFCPAVYMPVCGSDGKTYSNKCQAECADVEAECRGTCPCPEPSPPECTCPDVYDPVCGKDDTTYSNRCEAGCANVDVDCKGECPCRKPPPKDECRCPRNRSPVCGADGYTYPNECEAKCKDVTVECKGECPCKIEPPACIPHGGNCLASVAASATFEPWTRNCCDGMKCCYCRPVDYRHKKKPVGSPTCQWTCPHCRG